MNANACADHDDFNDGTSRKSRYDATDRVAERQGQRRQPERPASALRADVDQVAEFEELLANSSLGTAEAVAARRSGARTLADFRPEAEQHSLANWPSNYSSAADIYRTLGQRLESQGNASGAELWYRTALINEFDGDTATRLAAALERKGQKTEALTWYVRAAESGYPSASFRIAVLCTDAGDQATAGLLLCMAQAQLDPAKRSIIKKYVTSNKRGRSKQPEVTNAPEAMFYVASCLHMNRKFTDAYNCYSKSLAHIYSLGVLGMNNLNWASKDNQKPEDRREQAWFANRCEHLKQTIDGETKQALWTRPNPTSLSVEDKTDALLAAALKGDRNAVEGLLRWIRPLVVRYCRARLGRLEKTFAVADDVAQDVCLAVLTALPSYRDQGRPFLAFVYGIAAHQVADAHRTAARAPSQPATEVPDKSTYTKGPEQHALDAELASKMTALLSTLPDKQREILVLRVVVGLSAEETAAAVGTTPGGVRVAQHRALARLRQALATTDPAHQYSSHNSDNPPGSALPLISSSVHSLNGQS